jgi:methionyl-tRNA formyltransferase
MFAFNHYPDDSNLSLRGAAPIHHALLLNRPFTGVSVQTLHPTKFDHGMILDQSPLPGIPIPPNSTPQDLQGVLSKEGARLLQRVIQRRTFVDPAPISYSRETLLAITGGQGLAKAPKITKENSRIDWSQMTASQILLRWRVFGKVWDEMLYSQLGGSQLDTRVVYQCLRAIPTPSKSIRPGSPFLIDNEELEGPGIAIRTRDGEAIQIVKCTVAGGKSTGGAGVRELVKLLKCL